jgi:hypothetical protein
MVQAWFLESRTFLSVGSSWRAQHSPGEECFLFFVTMPGMPFGATMATIGNYERWGDPFVKSFQDLFWVEVLQNGPTLRDGLIRVPVIPMDSMKTRGRGKRRCSCWDIVALVFCRSNSAFLGALFLGRSWFGVQLRRASTILFLERQVLKQAPQSGQS